MRVIMLMMSMLIFTTSVFADNNAPQSNDTINDGIPVGFVQTAPAGRVTPIKGQPGHYKLVLENVVPYITYYTHRPNRATGLAPIQSFIQTWSLGKNSFAIDNPNAVVHAGQINGQPNRSGSAYIVQLSNPKYNTVKNEMSYVATPLNTANFVLHQFTLANVVLIIH